MNTLLDDLQRLFSQKLDEQSPDQVAIEQFCRQKLPVVIHKVKELSEEVVRLRAELEAAKAESLLSRKDEFLYHSVFDNAVVAILIVSSDDRIVNVNHAAENMLGCQVEELQRLRLSEITLPADQFHDSELKQDLIDGKKLFYHVEKRYVRSDGMLFWGFVTVFIVVDSFGTVSLVHMLEDISAQKSAELQLQHASSRDSLTGLYNRAYFDTEFTSLQHRMVLPVSIVVIDVDGLKVVNDTMGHEAGDRLIISVASILTEAFRDDDIVARVGGDEFSVLLPETGEDGACTIVERLRKCQARFNEVHSDSQVNFSVGIATAFKGEEMPKTLKLADERMYAEKVMRKGSRAAQSLAQGAQV